MRKSGLVRIVCASLLVIGLAGACMSSGSGGPSKPPDQHVKVTGPPAHLVHNPLGVKWGWGQLDVSQSYLERIAGGASWDQAVWCDIESKQGHRDWSTLDRRVKLARQLGFSFALKIRVGACWATTEGPSHERGVRGITESRMPKDLHAYADFVKATVKRYAPEGVHEYAIENEPNAKIFWEGTVKELVSLTRTAAKAIRAADPKAKVVSWGLASEPYGRGMVARLLAKGHTKEAVSAYNTYFARRGNKVSSGAALHDVLGQGTAATSSALLQAAERLLADGVFDVRQVHFYESWRSVPALLDYLHATTPDGVPIEVWEAGQFWTDGPSDQRLRAAQVVKTVALFLAGGVQRVIWLPLMTGDTSGVEMRYGLLAPGGGDRLSGKAFSQLAKWSGEATAHPVSTNTGLSGVAFAHGSSTKMVIWSDRDQGQRLSKPHVGVKVLDMGGHQVSWPSVDLKVDRYPVFVDVDAPLPKALDALSR